MSHKVLVCDDISEVGLDILRRAKIEVIRLGRRQSRAALVEALAGCVGILVRSRTKVNRQLLASVSELKVIGRAGYGLDTIDVAEATKRGIVVLHSPEGNATSAAEFSIGLLFALARHIPQADAALRRGRWDKRRYRGVEIAGKTLGVLGMGRVGRLVVQRALSLQMKVQVHDPAIPRQDIRSLGAQPVSWDDLLGSSDFLSVHVNASERSRGLVDDDAFALMKDRVRLINCARGGIVDEAALVRALRSGKVAGAAIDAFTEEPPTGSPLLKMSQVIVTPHLVGTTFEAQINVAVALAEQVRDFLLDGEAAFAVNPEALRARG